MGALKRLNHIYKTIKSFYPELIHSKSSSLFINYPDAKDLQRINLPNISHYSDFKNQCTYAQMVGLETLNTIVRKYEIVIVTVSKSRLESLGQIAKAYESTKRGGILVVDGNKQNGIDSIIKTLSKTMKIEHLTAKSHGKTGIIKVSDTIKIFSNWIKYNFPIENEDGFFSVPGLFSYRKIDPASEYLSSIFNNQINGNVIGLPTNVPSNAATKFPLIKYAKITASKK